MNPYHSMKINDTTKHDRHDFYINQFQSYFYDFAVDDNTGISSSSDF